MIIDQVRGDIFTAPQKHIAFAVNTTGCNDEGFAGQVASRFWPEIAHTGGNDLGEVLTQRVDGITFHALVCHTTDWEGAWSKSPRLVRECLDNLDVPGDEEIAVVLMGSGPIGQKQGADVDAILAGLHESKKRVIVYTR